MEVITSQNSNLLAKFSQILKLKSPLLRPPCLSIWLKIQGLLRTIRMLDESLTDKSPTDKSPMDKSPKEKTPKLTKANLTCVFGAFIGAPNGSDQNELIK